MQAACRASIPDTLAETGHLARETSWVFVAALFLKAYSLGGGTYTGIEAVSNNVQSLKEPRVRTGKLTMLYMAASLAFTAGGIILLYLLWHAVPVEGSTLNAVVFGRILDDMGFSRQRAWPSRSSSCWPPRPGLLFVAANTGFLGGPAVLANMATDSWMPHKFRYLSTRLVTQNGILLMGAAAIFILILSHGAPSTSWWCCIPSTCSSRSACRWRACASTGSSIAATRSGSAASRCRPRACWSR